jgi:hypothetical protein
MSRNWISSLLETRFLAGLQCPKRLYLECYSREVADPIDPGQQAIFESGRAVGVLAQQRYPDGRVADEPYYDHEEAIAITARPRTRVRVRSKRIGPPRFGWSNHPCGVYPCDV